MSKSFLLDPAEVRERLQRRFARQRGDWLRGGGSWPLQFPLGLPSEDEALRHGEAVRRWMRAWQNWNGPGEIDWVERRWHIVGTHCLPARVRFADPQIACEMLGTSDAWTKARQRLARIADRWPSLQDAAARNWPVLAEWEDAEFERLIGLLDWLQAHPGSGLYPRQLSVPGVDGKWLERHRRVLVDWLGALQGAKPGERDLSRLAGLRSLPARLRLRVLDPALRGRLGGLGDIEAPVQEVAALQLPAQRIFIVENLQTGLAFGDLPGAVVFMQQGYAVDVFAAVPWLAECPVHYWGDIDTHGLAILDRLRRHVPHARSLLMDEATLLAHRELWGHEARPAQAAELPCLTLEEAALYRDLRRGRFGAGVRLEQERIPWPFVLDRLRKMMSKATGGSDESLARQDP